MFAVIVNCFFVLRLRSRKRSLRPLDRTTAARCRKLMWTIMKSSSYFSPILATINITYRFWYKSKIQNFTKIRMVGVALFHED